jgi:hypothetical protein
MAHFECVNWSSIAVRAFEAEVGRLAAEKKEKLMDDVIDRLRASKRESESREYKTGLEVGREWAKNRADADELERLAFVRSRLNDRDWHRSLQKGMGHKLMPGERLALTIIGNEVGKPTQHELIKKWEEIVEDHIGDRCLQADFVRGVADGALEVWNAVKDHI